MDNSAEVVLTDFPTARRDQKMLFCSMPGCQFSCRSYVNYVNHVESNHQCPRCLLYSTYKDLHVCAADSMRGGNAEQLSKVSNDKFNETSRSHKGTIIEYTYTPEQEFQDLALFLNHIEDSITKLLTDIINVHTNIKAQLIFWLDLEQEIDVYGDKFIKTDRVHLLSENLDIFNEEAISEFLFECAAQIIQKLSNFNRLGSNWRLKRVDSVYVKIGALKLFSNVRVSGWLPMPSKRKGYLNIENKCHRCFHFCVVAHKYRHILEEENKRIEAYNKGLDPGEAKRTKLRMRAPSNYIQFLDNFDFSPIGSGTDIHSEIPAFEKLNNMSINMFSHYNNNLVLLKKGLPNMSDTVNLYLIRKECADRTSFHFVLITNLSSFCNNGDTNARKTCTNCFRKFSKKIDLDIHTRNCKSGIEKIEFPRLNTLSFKRTYKTLPLPYVLLYKMNSFSVKPTNVHSARSVTINSEFVPASVSILIYQYFPEGSQVIFTDYYEGNDVIEYFLKMCFYWGHAITKYVRTANHVAAPFAYELERHTKATHCDLCLNEFTKPIDNIPEGTNPILKCYHHDHSIGRGCDITICSICNLQVRYKHFLPVVAHDASKINFHLVVQALKSKVCNVDNISIIGKSAENIISIFATNKRNYNNTIGRKRFFDSTKPYSKATLRFTDSSLLLPSTLTELYDSIKSTSDMNILSQCIGRTIPQCGSPELLAQVLPYPGTLLTGPKLFEFEGVPHRSAFQDVATKEFITDGQWNMVKTIYETYGIKTLREYIRLYSMTHVAILGEIWSNFQKTGLQTYGLDPNYSLTISSYSWDAWLYSSGSVVEFVKDDRILDIFKRSIKGGVCFVNSKYIVANNESSKEYNKDRDRTHIISTDLTSLYPFCMEYKMPVSNYEYLTGEEISNVDWMNIGKDSDIGYFLVVSLEYPPEVHNADLPLAPETVMIKLDELSDYQKDLLAKNRGMYKRALCQERLLMTCYDKVKYSVHYLTLQYYIQKGMRVLEYHEGVRFRQEPYFQSYIDRNMQQRAVATSPFESTFYKLLNNTIYGKSLQDVTKHINIKLCTSQAKAVHLLSNSRCKDFKGIDSELSMIILKRKRFLQNNIVQAAVTILDIAKMVYYQRIDQLRETFNNNVSIYYGDTDSAYFGVVDRDGTLFTDLMKHSQYFDFSTLPEEHPIFRLNPSIRLQNKSKPGAWKLLSLDIAEFIALRPKQYSCLYFNDSQFQKAGGIPTTVAKNYKHEFYKQIVTTDTSQMVKVNLVKSINHRVYSVSVDILGYHSLSLGRVFPYKDNLNYSLPFGHKDLICK